MINNSIYMKGIKTFNVNNRYAKSKQNYNTKIQIYNKHFNFIFRMKKRLKFQTYFNFQFFLAFANLTVNISCLTVNFDSWAT
jgi:hypothetical protein